MAAVFKPLGAQETILRHLSELLSPNQHDSLILAHPPGSGKTYACLAFIAQRVMEHNASFDSAPKETLRLIASEEEVHEAAAQIDYLLKVVLQRNCGQVNYELSTPQFRGVKKSWLALYPGKSIDYSTTEVVSAYSCGTTLLHAVFSKQLFEQLQLLEGVKKVLVLCGGSGAELIGLKLLANCSLEKVTVVDIFEWEGASSSIWKDTESLEFYKADLLESKHQERVARLVRNAQLVTLLYGLTELYDKEEENAEKLIEVVVENLQQGSKFVVLDPYKTCHGKDKWLDLLASRGRATSENNHRSIKLVMPEEFVHSSRLEKWISRMKLKLNEDVKLSMNVWYRVISPNEAVQPTIRRTKSKYYCLCCYSGNRLRHSLGILDKFGCKDQVLTLGTLTGSETPEERRAALFHLRGSAFHCQRLGKSFALCITYHQMELFSSAPDFAELLRGSDCVFLDDLQLYIPSFSEKKAKTKLSTLNQLLPAGCKRVSLCGDPKKLRYCESLALHRNCVLMKASEAPEVQASLCCTAADCLGILDSKHAVYVKYGQNLSQRTPRHLSLKEFEHHVGPLPGPCCDVVFEGFAKFSEAKRDEIYALAKGKLAHVGKISELHKEQRSFNNELPSRKRKLCEVVVRVHFH